LRCSASRSSSSGWARRWEKHNELETRPHLQLIEKKVEDERDHADP
jgi:hypothetical protein